MKKINNLVIISKHTKPIVTDVYYKETQQPKKIIVFCHGYKGFKDWGAWHLMAEAFANAGFLFLKFNFSHNGGTLEQPIDFPDLEAFGNNNYTKELDDLNSVLNWVCTATVIKKEADTNHIYLIGHSRGGGIVLLKAFEDSRVKKVVTLAGVCDFGKRTATIGNVEQWKKQGVKYVLNVRTKQQMPHFYQFYEDFIKNENRLNIKKATENITIPQLIIHGDSDTSVSIKEAENLHQWNPKSQFKIIKNANHVFNVSHPWKKQKMSNELHEVTQICIAFLG